MRDVPPLSRIEKQLCRVVLTILSEHPTRAMCEDELWVAAESRLRKPVFPERMQKAIEALCSEELVMRHLADNKIHLQPSGVVAVRTMKLLT